MKLLFQPIKLHKIKTMVVSEVLSLLNTGTSLIYTGHPSNGQLAHTPSNGQLARTPLKCCLFVLEFYSPVNNEVMSSRSVNSGTVPTPPMANLHRHPSNGQPAEIEQFTRVKINQIPVCSVGCPKSIINIDISQLG